MSIHQKRGKFFEDFSEGEEYVTPSRTITEADVTNFAGLTADWSPVHTSIEACKGGLFGERIAHGALTIVVAEGLQNRLNLWDDTFVGMVDREWSFKSAVKFGDTLTVKMKITGKEEASDYPGCGLIKRYITIENQRGEIVSEGEGTILILKRTG